MKKKILVCAYFAKNVGDDLFLKLLFDRYPNVKWDLLTANRNYKKIFSDYKNVNIIYTYRNIDIGNHCFTLFFKINDKILHFKNYDALLNIGGSIFMQSPAWKMKWNEREYLLNNFKKMNKKAFILGANFGPYKDKEFVEKYRELFTRYDDICFRDYHSYNLFKDFENVRLAPDVVFSLEVNNDRQKEKCVGFSIIDIEKREGLMKYYHNYNNKIIQLIERYIHLGYKVKLFSFCNNEGDYQACTNIKTNLSDKYQKHINITDYNGKIDEFLDAYKSCEVIIGTRFHSIILALLFNQSFFPIIYNEKTYNMLKDLNMEENCCFIKNIEKLDINRAIMTRAINNRIDNAVIKESRKQFEKLDLFMNNNPISKKVK